MVLEPQKCAALRLFCFPYAGGGPPIFRGWTDGLPAQTEACALLLPGRGKRLREPIWYDGIEALADKVAAEMTVLLDRPFALFGHSFGALLAFETARRIEKQGRQPAALIVSGHIAPQLPDRNVPVHDLPRDALIHALCKLNGMPEELLASRDVLDLLLPAVRADLEAVETYAHRPGEPLDVPLLALWGSGDPRAGRHEVEAWREQSRAEFQFETIEGDHFFVDHQRPHVLRAISSFLQRHACL